MRTCARAHYSTHKPSLTACRRQTQTGLHNLYSGSANKYLYQFVNLKKYFLAVIIFGVFFIPFYRTANAASYVTSKRTSVLSSRFEFECSQNLSFVSPNSSVLNTSLIRTSQTRNPLMIYRLLCLLSETLVPPNFNRQNYLSVLVGLQCLPYVYHV